MTVSSSADKLVIDPKSIQGLKYFSALSPLLLERLHDVGTARDKAGHRDLFCDQYVSLILWNYEHKKAAKRHLHFEVVSAAPVRAEITAGQGCEKKPLHRMLEAGRFSVFDRGYEKFPLFQDIVDANSSFVGSVRGQMTWTVLHERELSNEARRGRVET